VAADVVADWDDLQCADDEFGNPSQLGDSSQLWNSNQPWDFNQPWDTSDGRGGIRAAVLCVAVPAAIAFSGAIVHIRFHSIRSHSIRAQAIRAYSAAGDCRHRDPARYCGPDREQGDGYPI
jgi:hypothetical protein